jgi:hypothetical protein
MCFRLCKPAKLFPVSAKIRLTDAMSISELDCADCDTGLIERRFRAARTSATPVSRPSECQSSLTI